MDRNFGDAQALWTVAPDGTNQAIYWGNNTPAPGGVIDARIIPGTQQAVCIFSSCHDLSWGALAVIDRRLGLDGRAPVVRIWPESARDLVKDPGTANNAWDGFMRVRPKYKDPYPLCPAFFLVSRLIAGGGGPRDADNRTGIFLVDVFGNELLLHTEAPGCFNPTLLAPTARPARIPPRRDFENAGGAMYVQDVYEGVHMTGVPRGAVKYLRVVESPEKRYWVPGVWVGQGVHHPGVNWHSFATKRILGTVPVEPDGSAYSWGSHASPLMRVLRNEHDKHDAVELNADEFARIAAWIDLNAVFYPDYATSYPTNPGGRSPIDGSQLNRLAELTGQDFGRHFSHSGNQGPLVSFDRPELSPILKRFVNPTDPAYLEALAIIRAGKEALAALPDVGMAGFEFSGIDLWRELKYQQRRQIELQYRQALREGKTLYDSEATRGVAPGVATCAGGQR